MDRLYFKILRLLLNDRRKRGKATLYIPGELGYGVDGAPRAGIGPNAMLIFDIEVLDINPKN